jgi:hypothetical protein
MAPLMPHNLPERCSGGSAGVEWANHALDDRANVPLLSNVILKPRLRHHIIRLSLRIISVKIGHQSERIPAFAPPVARSDPR